MNGLLVNVGRDRGNGRVVERNGIEPIVGLRPDRSDGTNRAPRVNRNCRSIDPMVGRGSGVLRCTQTYSGNVERRSSINLALWVQNARAATTAGRFVLVPYIVTTSSRTAREPAAVRAGSRSKSSTLTPSTRAKRSSSSERGRSPRSIADNSCWRMRTKRETWVWVRSRSRRSLRTLWPTCSSMTSLPSERLSCFVVASESAHTTARMKTDKPAPSLWSWRELPGLTWPCAPSTHFVGSVHHMAVPLTRPFPRRSFERATPEVLMTREALVSGWWV